MLERMSTPAHGLHAAPRYTGLDTLRAVAILLVLMYHYMAFVSGEPTFGWLSTAGWMGVDLFFVLSGFLVADQIFRMVKTDGQVKLGRFYGRRILRTWPLFWVVLAAYFLFPQQMGGKPPPELWRFLTFTQNFGLQPGTAFSHAWSLCVEEQFYLVLPWVILLTRALRRPVAAAWVVLGLLLGFGISARHVLWSKYGLASDGQINGYFPHIYYSTLCRFDEFLPGVAIALIKNHHPDLWQQMRRRGKLFFYAGLAAVAAVSYGVITQYYVQGHGYPFFMTTFGYSLIAFAFSWLVVAALGEKSPLSHWRIPGAHGLAVWSYAIYLSHKAVYFIVGKQAGFLANAPSVRLLVVGVATLAVGAALHHLVERPAMGWRAKAEFKPSAHDAMA